MKKIVSILSWIMKFFSLLFTLGLLFSIPVFIAAVTGGDWIYVLAPLFNKLFFFLPGGIQFRLYLPLFCTTLVTTVVGEEFLRKEKYNEASFSFVVGLLLIVLLSSANTWLHF